MDKNFEQLFSSLIVKEVVKILIGDQAMSIKIEEIINTSIEILSFDTTEQALVDNIEFVKAFGIARVKAKEVLLLSNALLVLRKKYKVSDFDFQLLLEGFDEENLFGNG